MKTGTELLEEVFADLIEEYGEINLYEIQDLDDVTNYDEQFDYHSGWYNYYIVSFEYKGKKYSYEYHSHTADNIADTYYDKDTFQEIPMEKIEEFSTCWDDDMVPITDWISEQVSKNKHIHYKVTITISEDNFDEEDEN